MQARVYIIVFFGTLALALGAIASVNWYADANGVYRGNARQEEARAYVSALLQSPYGLVAHNDERSVKFELARQTDADCYTTGSSHEMEIAANTFPAIRDHCTKHINLGLAGGTYEDLVTSLSILLTHRHLKHVFIGIEPWMFRWNADVRLSEQRDVNAQARKTLGLVDTAIANDHFDMAANLLNGSYFYANVKRMLHPTPTETTQNFKEMQKDARNLLDDEHVFRPDGTYHYSVNFMKATPTPIGQVGNGEYKIAKPYLDPTLTKEFENLIQSVLDRGIDITFLIMPYHPKVLECGSKDVCDAFMAVETYARKVAGEKGINVIGGYDPAPMKLKPDDFYDVMHVNGSRLHKIR
ncbi:MAG TPA: hypothetical protein VIN59_02865 [Alphaproteobacteria bacterium]